MALSGANEQERKLLKTWGMIGIGLVTFGLCCLNVTGAWIISGAWQYTMIVAGAEVCAAVFLGLAVIAQTLIRKAVGFALFAIIMLICVENGKFAVRDLFDGIFVDSVASLEKKATLLEAGLDDLKAGQTAAEDRAADALADKRRRVAEYRAEQNLMAAPGRVREAQTRLQALDLYRLPVDGIDGPETRQARLSRGAYLANEIAVLDAEIRDLEGAAAPAASSVDLENIGQAAVTLTAAQLAQASADELRAQARTVVYYERWMHLLLYGLELVRSAALWAFIMTSTAAGTARRADQESDAAETITPDEIKDKVMEDEAGASEEPAVESDLTRRGRNGARARAIYRQARENQKVELDDVSFFDAENTRATA